MTDVPVTVTVNTDDAAPAAAPYKISNHAGRDEARVDLYPTAPGTVRYAALRRGGTSLFSGTRLVERGAMCGVSRCGMVMPMSTFVPTGAHFETIILPFATVTDGGADGARTIMTYVAR